jgi:hypothetical protein
MCDADSTYVLKFKCVAYECKLQVKNSANAIYKRKNAEEYKLQV